MWDDGGGPSPLRRLWSEPEGKEETAIAALTFIGTVYPHQLDHMGHMNVQHYVAMFDQASWAFFESFGLSARRMELEGLGMAALVQHNEYRQELFAGTVVDITTEVLEVNTKTVRFRHVMRRRPDRAVAATSELVAALIDRRERRARPWPDDLREALKRQLEPPASAD